MRLAKTAIAGLIVAAAMFGAGAGGGSASAHYGYWQCDPYQNCWYTVHYGCQPYHTQPLWMTWCPQGLMAQ